jgi:hypothetical protein
VASGVVVTSPMNATLNKITAGHEQDRGVTHEQDQGGVNTAVAERRPRLNKIHGGCSALNTRQASSLPMPGATVADALVFMARRGGSDPLGWRLALPREHPALRWNTRGATGPASPGPRAGTGHDGRC